MVIFVRPKSALHIMVFLKLLCNEKGEKAEVVNKVPKHDWPIHVCLREFVCLADSSFRRSFESYFITANSSERD